jgi:hypothetical protein
MSQNVSVLMVNTTMVKLIVKNVTILSVKLVPIGNIVLNVLMEEKWSKDSVNVYQEPGITTEVATNVVIHV